VLAPLTVQGWFTTWRLDVPVAVVAGVAFVAYLRAARRRGDWPVTRTVNLAAGLLALVVVRSSFVAVYDHTLFWALAVQDVLLVAVVPLPLALARPWELLPGGTRGWSLPPVAGSLLAVGTLLAVYVTGWDALRLDHAWLFRLTQLVLVGAGTAFLGPLLGDGPSGYGGRTLVAFADGLLDALPGLAVLSTHGLIAATWYDAHVRSWGPSPLKDQQIGGTAMVALAELVGLPTLLVLLVQWVRADAGTAAVIDAELDAAGPRAPRPVVTAAPPLERPWWERDPGPLAARLRREEEAGP
jgi:putative copper resistance protein D